MCTQWRKAHSVGDPSKQLSQETRGVYGYTLVQIACTPLWRGRPPQSSRHRGALGKSCRYQVAAHIAHIDHTRTSSEIPLYHTQSYFTQVFCPLPFCYHFVSYYCTKPISFHTTVPQYKIYMPLYSMYCSTRLPLYHSTTFPCYCTTVQDCPLGNFISDTTALFMPPRQANPAHLLASPILVFFIPSFSFLSNQRNAVFGPNRPHNLKLTEQCKKRKQAKRKDTSR